MGYPYISKSTANIPEKNVKIKELIHRNNQLFCALELYYNELQYRGLLTPDLEQIFQNCAP